MRPAMITHSHVQGASYWAREREFWREWLGNHDVNNATSSLVLGGSAKGARRHRTRPNPRQRSSPPSWRDQSSDILHDSIALRICLSSCALSFLFFLLTQMFSFQPANFTVNWYDCIGRPTLLCNCDNLMDAMSLTVAKRFEGRCCIGWVWRWISSVIFWYGALVQYSKNHRPVWRERMMLRVPCLPYWWLWWFE